MLWCLYQRLGEIVLLFPEGKEPGILIWCMDVLVWLMENYDIEG